MTFRLPLTCALLLATVVAACASAARAPEREPAKECRSSQMAEYAYATGCYEAYKRICLEFAKEEKVNLCREDGLAICERSGRNFRLFVENKERPKAGPAVAGPEGLSSK